MKIIDTAQAMPTSGHFVLAWLEGSKIPMRALWADKFSLGVSAEQDPELGEYCEEKDEYFCPAGWYEMNQHEESHWRVDGNVVAWCELPRLDHQCLAQIVEPAAPAAVAGPADPLVWTPGPNEFKDWCAQWFGPDSDDNYLAEAVHALPPMAQRFARLAAAPALEAPAAPAVPPLTPDEARWAARSADRMRGPSDVTSGTEYAMAGAMALAKKLAAAPQAPAAPVEFQQRVQPWMMACFGAEIAADRAERNHRFLEESLELVQSCGCTASEAHQLVNYVFGRPVGEPAQEVGGVMVTLAALCLANSLDMHAAGETELARIWGKVEQIRAKQAAKPKHSPLPAAPAAPAVDDERAAYVAFLTGEFPGMYSQAEAERWWDQRHVSAETWKAARASANGAKA